MLRRRIKKLFDPEKRRKAQWDALNDKARRHGFEMYKSHLNWLNDPDFLAARQIWGKTPGNATDRIYLLFAVAKTLKDVSGDTVDIGVRFGSSSFFMLKGLNDGVRSHHVFDSFEGLSAPTEQDRNVDTKKIFWRKGDIAVAEEVTRQCLHMFSNIHYYKGWVPERFPEVEGRQFAMVHIDVDLYQPTRESLEFFYPRMAPGGMIICDDYGFSTCPGATRAVDEFFAGKEAVLSLPTGQSLVIKR